NDGWDNTGKHANGLVDNGDEAELNKLDDKRNYNLTLDVGLVDRHIRRLDNGLRKLEDETNYGRSR
ncbi:19575_t:CDS:2, partial [Entrophospora sp. SA101]